MSNIKSFRPAPVEADVFSSASDTPVEELKGRLVAWAHFEIVNLSGQHRTRRIRIGQDWDVKLADARDMVRDARKANMGLTTHVSAAWSIDL